MDKKLSFILPVYNVEDYLRECIDSILKQLTEECEIILVNDGSSDTSGLICEEYARTNADSIHVIHKENKGVSEARNTGLELAEGEFIAFVDADDRISFGAVKEILEWIHNGGSDICFMKAIKFYQNGHVEDMGDEISRSLVYKQDKKSVLEYLSLRPKYSGSACTKIFRKDFLNEHNIKFSCARNHAEDLSMVRDCILAAKDFDALEIPYYEYRQGRKGAATSSISSKSFYDLVAFIDESETLVKLNLNSFEKMFIRSIVVYEYMILLWQYGILQKEERMNAYKALKRFMGVMKYASTPKTKLVRIMLNFVGIKGTALILKQFMAVRTKY